MEGYTMLSDCIGFGKYKDRDIRWVMINDIDYLQWMVNQPNIRKRLQSLPPNQVTVVQSKLDERSQHRNNKLQIYAQFGKI